MTNTDHSLGQPRDNGAYANRTFTPPADSTTLPAAGEDLGVRPADILPGDTVFGMVDDELLALGRAVVVRPHPKLEGRVQVVFASGGGISADPDDIVSVHRDSVAPEYRSDDGYYDKLAVAYHRLTSEKTLLDIVANEAEDDFMLAVVTHPNASAIAIDRAAHHSSWAVRAGAITNPTISSSTLRWLEQNAHREAVLYTEQDAADGRCPGTEHTRWNIDQAQKQIAAAQAVLAARSAE
jgi:hypothetical protein